MNVNIEKNNDLVTLEFLKEARILKRQLQLMKNNIEQIEIEDLMKIWLATKIIEKEVSEFNTKSEVILSTDETKKHM